MQSTNELMQQINVQPAIPDCTKVVVVVVELRRECDSVYAPSSASREAAEEKRERCNGR